MTTVISDLLIFHRVSKTMPWKLFLAVPTAIAITGTHSLLLALSKDKDGHIPFSSSIVVMLQEVAKLFIVLIPTYSMRFGWTAHDWVYLVCYHYDDGTLRFCLIDKAVV